MPIRFRCAYCNQLMGISHRKMGSIVRCPKCSGQVVVPQVDEEPAHEPEAPSEPIPVPSAAVKALEDPELEKLLAGAAAEVAAKPKLRPAKRSPAVMPEIDVEPLDMPLAPIPVPFPRQPVSESAPQPGMVTMPRGVMFGVATMILLLLGLAFLVGYLLGRNAAGAS